MATGSHSIEQITHLSARDLIFLINEIAGTSQLPSIRSSKDMLGSETISFTIHPKPVYIFAVISVSITEEKPKNSLHIMVEPYWPLSFFFAFLWSWVGIASSGLFVGSALLINEFIELSDKTETVMIGQALTVLSLYLISWLVDYQNGCLKKRIIERLAKESR